MHWGLLEWWQNKRGWYNIHLMKPSVQKLYKIIKLEAERGFDDRAVLGGLARMLGSWEAEARLEGVREDFIQLVLTRLRDYQRLSTNSRQEALQGLWRRLGSESGMAEPFPQKQRPPASAPSGAASSQPGEKKAHSKKARRKLAAKSAPPRSTAHQSTVQAFTSHLADNQPPAAAGEELGVESAEEDEDDEFVELPPETQQAAGPSIQATVEAPPAALNAPVRVLPGVGPRHEQTLGRLRLKTLGDMLYYFPRRYDDYTQLKPINRLWYGEEVTVIGTVQSLDTRMIRGRKFNITEAVVSDGSGALRINWFNQPWITRRVRLGMHVVLSGKVDQYLGRLVINNLEIEPLEQENLHTNRIVPVYPLTANITQRWLRRTLHQVISFWGPRLQDPLPAALRQAAGVIDLPTALLQTHFPDSWDLLKAARHRLAFDEILFLQLGLLEQKRAWKSATARSFTIEPGWLQGQINRLPYRLTRAQQSALADLCNDLAGGRPMNRLLQGDVGSGKTVVAALAIAAVTHQGAQAALMAPTSILAEQHYRNLLSLLAGAEASPGDGNAGPAAEPTTAAAASPDEMPSAAIPHSEPPPSEPPLSEPPPSEPPLSEPPLSEPPLSEPPLSEPPLSEMLPAGPQPEMATSSEPPGAEDLSLEAIPPAEPPLRPEHIRLMIGATPEAEKRAIRSGLADGSLRLVIGTHALIEDPVTFADLQLAVIDEQHRFGVEQRAALRQKGHNPHLLVMTATPIPRSLALTVYGDLDLSVIDEMPPGRQAITTRVLAPQMRERAYELIRREVAQGRQAFIIYPLVEETGASADEPGSARFSSAASPDGGQAAVEEHARLQKEIFPNYRLGLLHGRMRQDEKDSVMARFRDRQVQVLVSTSVVEVGVDIPNASVMLIEGANRFGLAQLHQFRGRVGRGAAKSYCLLIPDTEDSLENERLAAMEATNDGFILAEKDLEQRGPGQFLGTRQSGLGDLRLANLTDLPLIEKARRFAQDVFSKDPDLALPEHQLLAQALQRYWQARVDPS
jgi:RecG-like helicase